MSQRTLAHSPPPHLGWLAEVLSSREVQNRIILEAEGTLAVIQSNLPRIVDSLLLHLSDKQLSSLALS